MGVELVWLDQAQDDLQAISNYIAANSPRAARGYVDAIAAACARLADFPESGRRYDERYRILAVRNHVVFYHYQEASRSVSIVTIIDGRRDIEALLDNDP